MHANINCRKPPSPPRSDKVGCAILLPTYNGAAYLSTLLDSVLAQTKQVEVVCRDDGSTDNTPSILSCYAAATSRLSWHRGACRLGPAGNVAHLLEQTDAEFYALADQDDVWHPNKMERLTVRLSGLEAEHGSDMPLLVYSDARVVDQDGRVMNPSFRSLQGLPVTWGSRLSDLLVMNPAPGCTMLFNRALRRLALPFPDRIIMHDWWLLLVAAAAGRFAYLPEALVDYRQHGANTLGASGWSSAHILRKICRGPRMSMKNIKKTQIQSGELLARLGGVLSEEDMAVVSAWAFLAERTFLARRLTCLRHGFAKPGLLRNLIFQVLA